MTGLTIFVEFQELYERPSPSPTEEIEVKSPEKTPNPENQGPIETISADLDGKSDIVVPTPIRSQGKEEKEDGGGDQDTQEKAPGAEKGVCIFGITSKPMPPMGFQETLSILICIHFVLIFLRFCGQV